MNEDLHHRKRLGGDWAKYMHWCVSAEMRNAHNFQFYYLLRPIVFRWRGLNGVAWWGCHLFSTVVHKGDCVHEWEVVLVLVLVLVLLQDSGEHLGKGSPFGGAEFSGCVETY